MKRPVDDDGAVTATNNIFVGNSGRVGAGVATSGADSSANLSYNVSFNNLDTGGAEHKKEGTAQTTAIG
jgi:hypothetical protein